MNRRKFLKASAAAASILAVPSILHASSAKPLRIGTITPGSHFWSKSMVRFGENLAKKTNGAFKVSVFPSGQLGNEAAMVQQIQTGALDMGFLTVGEFSNRIDDMASLFAPYLVGNVGQAAKLLKGKIATGMLDQYAELGMKGLGFGLGGMRHLISRGPAKSVTDLKGQKFRITPFAPLRDFYDLMDIAPTPVPLPGLFDALANGQVDGADIDLELAWKLKLYNQAKYLTTTNHMMFPVVAVMSGRFWAKLSGEHKNAVQAAASEEIDWLYGRYNEFDPKWLQDLRGTEINVQTADKSFFGPVLDQWEDKWRTKAPSIAALRAEAASL